MKRFSSAGCWPDCRSCPSMRDCRRWVDDCPQGCCHVRRPEHPRTCGGGLTAFFIPHPRPQRLLGAGTHEQASPVTAQPRWITRAETPADIPAVPAAHRRRFRGDPGCLAGGTGPRRDLRRRPGSPRLLPALRLRAGLGARHQAEHRGSRRGADGALAGSGTGPAGRHRPLREALRDLSSADGNRRA